VAVPPPVPPATYYSLGYHTHGGYADSIVASVQRALKARGYYRGPVNGDAGSGTRAAIRGFRADHGLGHSSRIDGPLLRALGL
jgi:peptidoglycan hydrolase-like protein with peptidoglycan-binding domain